MNTTQDYFDADNEREETQRQKDQREQQEGQNRTQNRLQHREDHRNENSGPEASHLDPGKELGDEEDRDAQR